MNVTMLLGVVVFLGLIRWDQKKLHLKTFIKEAIVLCIFVLSLQMLGSFITNKFHISFTPLDSLKVRLEMWIGAILIFSFAVYIAFKEWRNSSDEANHN